MPLRWEVDSPLRLDRGRVNDAYDNPVVSGSLHFILEADQVLVVQNGRIVQRGTHTELLKIQGLYAELYQSQP